MAVLTGASGLNTQYWQPLLAFSEYTALPALPTKTRPPTTVGCANARLTPWNPKAHFSFKRGTSLADNRAIAAGWKRCCARFAPHPFQFGCSSGLAREADSFDVQALLAGEGAPAGAVPSVRASS